MVEVRGTVHWLTHKDGPARALMVDPDARGRLPRVLGETGRAVWVTDASGADALETGAVTGEPETVRIADGLIGHVVHLAASPDGGCVAAAAHDGRLLVVDVASGQVTELAASDDGPVDGLSWSPDSAWLAWSQPELRPLARIRIARITPVDTIADREVIDVTDGRFADTSPVFTTDGLYLAFLSQRRSIRSTTRTRSTCRSRSAAVPTWCRSPRTLRRHSGRHKGTTGEPGSGRGSRRYGDRHDRRRWPA